MSEIPMRFYYLGQDIETMSREELISVVKDLGAWNKTLIEGAQADRMWTAELLKRLSRP